jgi:hypothetical protein
VSPIGAQVNSERLKTFLALLENDAAPTENPPGRRSLGNVTAGLPGAHRSKARIDALG